MEVAVSFLALWCLLLYIDCTNGAGAEYCKNYPGDIAFSYSTTVDEDYWYQNYQNAYTGKKGGGTYTIYRRRRIIHRHPRPRGSRPNSLNNANANVFNNINEIQQVQTQQQVQQVAPFPFDWNQVDGSGAANETEEEPEKKPLPIWKITIPRQCSRAVIARIENAQVVDSFELNSTHFQNPNLTATSGSSGPRSLVSSTAPSSYTRIIDITDQSMIPDSWYAVCLDVNIVEKGKPHICNHCTLIKAREDNGRQQFLDFDWVPASFQNTSAEVRFAAVDFPFPWATIRSKVWTKYPHPRCQDQPEQAVYESKDFAYPEHFTFTTVKNLVGKLSYELQVDVDFPWKQEPEGVLPKPFMISDYLHGDSTSTTLAKCEDYNYKGD